MASNKYFPSEKRMHFHVTIRFESGHSHVIDSWMSLNFFAHGSHLLVLQFVYKLLQNIIGLSL